MLNQQLTVRGDELREGMTMVGHGVIEEIREHAGGLTIYTDRTITSASYNQKYSVRCDHNRNFW